MSRSAEFIDKMDTWYDSTDESVTAYVKDKLHRASRKARKGLGSIPKKAAGAIRNHKKTIGRLAVFAATGR